MKNNLFLTLLLCLLTLPSIAQKKEINAAQTYLESEEYEKAISSINTAVDSKKGKTSKEAWTLRGTIYAEYTSIDRKTTSAQAAFDSYTQAESLGKSGEFKAQFKELAETCFIVAYVERQKKNYIDAVEFLLITERCAKKSDSPSDQVNFELAHCYFMMEKYDQSIEQFKLCIANNHLVSDSYYGIDNNYQMSFDYTTDMRIANIEEALEKLPENERILSIASEIYVSALNFTKAEEMSDKMIELYPESPNSYFAHGNAMSEAYTYWNRAGSHERSEDSFEKARKSYEKADELLPDNKSVQYSLGTLYYQRALEFQRELNELGFSDEDKKKYEKLTEESHTYLKKALPYLESVYFPRSSNSQEDKVLMNALKHIYLNLDMEEEYKNLITE